MMRLPDWISGLVARWRWKRVKSHRVEWHWEAGDVNVAVTLVAPWEEYVAALSPRFEMTGEKALQRVIPKTSSAEEIITSKFGATGGLDVDAVPLLNQLAGPEAATDPDKLDQGKRRPQRGAGDRKGPVPARAGGQVAARHSPSTGIGTKGGASGQDPMLEYTAATAFYQEVQLLNRYVADAALRRGFQAYVVRLQIGVVPFARHLPYDVYANVSFFPVGEPDNQPRAKWPREPAEVIPLLVTDNLESTIRSRSVDTTRQLLLTLGFLQPGIKAATKFDDMREYLDRALGADLNSLLTVGRVADNTIQIRLGAVREPGNATYSMIPRTHNITVLVMVPLRFVRRGDSGEFRPTLRVLTKSMFRDADSGEPLPHQTQDARLQSVEKLIARYGFPPHQRHEVADNLLYLVFTNDVEKFEKRIGDAQFEKRCFDTGLGSNFPQKLWEQVSQGATLDDISKLLNEVLPISSDRIKGLVDKAWAARSDADEFQRLMREAIASKEFVRDLWLEWNGARAANGADSACAGRIEEILAKLGVDPKQRRKLVQSLLRAIEGKNEAKFDQILRDAFPQSPFPRDLWSEIVETFGASEFAGVRLELPPSRPMRLPPPQSVVAADDGRSAMEVILSGSVGLDPKGMTAVLFVATKNQAEIPLQATELKIGPGDRELTIVLPSLLAWKIKDVRVQNSELKGAYLHLSHTTRSKWNLRLKGACVEERYSPIFHIKVQKQRPKKQEGATERVRRRARGRAGDNRGRAPGR